MQLNYSHLDDDIEFYEESLRRKLSELKEQVNRIEGYLDSKKYSRIGEFQPNTNDLIRIATLLDTLIKIKQNLS